MTDSFSELEKSVATAAWRGEWVTGTSGLPQAGRSDLTIRASAIREVLLNLRAAANGAPTHGVRLEGLIIEGALDLEDCGAEGATLSPLLLHRCLLSGSQTDATVPTIGARHAWLSRVSLTGSRIGGVVDLCGARLSGDLEIDGVSPIDERPCQIKARNARIQGSVLGGGTQLRIPQGQRAPEFGSPDYALNLAAAEISGSVLLQPSFRADGGVSVAGARIQGDVWAEGAELVASESLAFRAQSLRCDGVVALRATEKDGVWHRTKARGYLDFFAASMGHLDLRGMSIEHPPSGAAPDSQMPAIGLASAKVSHQFSLSDDGPGLSTQICGLVAAHSAEIGGSLWCVGLTVDSSPSARAVVAPNLHVRGDLVVRQFEGILSLAGARVEHDLNVIGVSASGETQVLFARNIEIGNDCQLHDVSGAATLELARIGGALFVGGAEFGPLNAKDAEVRGSVVLNGRTRHDLEFDGGNYRGEFRVERLEFVQVGDKAPRLTIEDAQIERDLNIKQTSTRSFALLDPLRRAPAEAIAAEPSFYPGWRLIESRGALEDGRPAILSVLTRAEQTVLLSGKSAVIHQMNEAKHLSLHSELAVAEYLKFFCAFVWGDEGAFFVVESRAALGTAELSEPVSLRPVSVRRDGDSWVCTAFTRYANALFEAEFRVGPQGTVEMTRDTPKALVKGGRQLSFIPPLRVTSGTPPADEPSAFWLPWICGETTAAPLDEVAKIMGKVQAADGTEGAGKAQVSLRGLRASALRHDPERSWGRGVQVILDGFDYDRIEDDRVDPTLAFKQAGAPARARARRRPRLFQARPSSRFAGSNTTWLSRQYETGQPTSGDEFFPQPYEQLARVLRNHGWADEAKLVTLEKLTHERRWTARPWTRPWLWIMEKGFDHGLFATKSVVLFLSFWLAGTVAFDFANHGCVRLPVGSRHEYQLSWPVLKQPVLVVDSLPVSSYLVRNPSIPGAPPGPAMPLAPWSDQVTQDVPCGDQIEPLWYALDVFVPLLDLKQEEKCTISSGDEFWGWRAFKSIYAVLGAVVSSLTVLTISGVLRRRAEQ